MVFNEQTIFQQIAPQTRCESSGVILDPNKVAESYQTEYTELSKLGVGEQISEKQAHEISDKAGTKILSSRWVVVLKTTGRVRARVVCRDYKSAGLTAFREDISSPTASLESLRLMLGSAYYSRGLLVTLDISTAFLCAELDGPAQVVLLPASVVDKEWRRIFVLLRKALYGLRRAPLAWAKTLRKFMLEVLGFEGTSDPSIFRKPGEDDGWVTLVLIYVDDLLLCGPPEVVDMVVKRLAEYYKIRETGRLVPTDTEGQLEFLGRIVRRHVPYGPISLSLPATYWDGIERTAGFLVKSVEVSPDLSKFVVKDEASSAVLGKTESELYRSVLGKLAWYSLTLPILSYHISWLSSYMQSPTTTAMTGLKAVLRFAKSFRGWGQVIPSPDGWMGEEDTLQVVVDASRHEKSTAGGILFYRGTALKAWSRRIGTVCLSSAEAELHALVEGLKEALGSSILCETVRYGLPASDGDTAEWRTDSSFKILIYTDSDATVHISGMQGLLRRVRHLQLRVMMLQQAVEDGRAEVQYITGRSNPADVLTKSPDKKAHLPIFLQAFGLCQCDPAIKQAEIEMTEGLDGFHLSRGNRFTVEACLSRMAASSCKDRWRRGLSAFMRGLDSLCLCLAIPHCQCVCLGCQERE